MTATAFVRRDILLNTSYRAAFAFDLIWGTLNVLLYYFISHIVGTNPSVELGGAPTYFAFAAAGILMSLIVNTAASEVGARLRDEQLTGTLEMLVAQPVGSAGVAAGTAIFPFAYATARVAVYLLVAVIVLGLPVGHASWFGVVLFVFLAGAAFTALGIAAAAAVLTFKRAAVVDAAIFAMVFISGAVFPLSALPSWVRPLGEVMPTRPAFEGFRRALFGGSWGVDAAALAGVAAIGIPIALALFEAALEHAKARGTLAQY